MGQQNVALAVFNRGVVDKRALGRVDVKRVAMAAETCVNWMPRSLGSMSLRPGLEYLDSTYSDLEARHIPFVYAVDDTAIIEITSGTMRVRVDERVIQRNSVSTAITNGTFTTDLTGWTDADESGATSAYATGDYLSLIGTRFNAAIRRQQVTVIQADRNVKHGLKIIIQRAKVTLKVGSTSGGDEYISETQLGAGQHSLSFTPTGSSFWVEFSNHSANILSRNNSLNLPRIIMFPGIIATKQFLHTISLGGIRLVCAMAGMCPENMISSLCTGDC